jgi:hypothetical protein
VWPLLLLLVPFFVWMQAPPGWHPWLAALYGAAALLVGAVWLRHLRRELRGARDHVAAHAGWHWNARATAEHFRRQFGIFLRLNGWRVLSSTIGARDRVELAARKDRWCVVLLCVGPMQEPPGPEDLRRAVTLRHDVGASLAVLVSDAGAGPAAAHPWDDARVLRLRFADLERLETAMGLSL